MANETRNEGVWEEINRNRAFLKCPDFKETMPESDQEKKLPQPPLCNAERGELIHLEADFGEALKNTLYSDLLDIRRSERVFNKDAPMTQSQLAFLLWSTQGVQDIKGANYATLRPVPSGGARHAFETYFVALNVEGLEKGLYHYVPLAHIIEKHAAVEFLCELPDMENAVTEMLAGQKWASRAQIVVIYSCVAYRAEWRYNTAAHRVVLIDAGHVGQNLMLSAAAVGLGSCCIAAFDQDLCDKALNLEGYEEFTIYTCAVGKPAKGI